MIVDISIDTVDLFSEFSISQQDVDTFVDRVVKNLTISFANEVELEAQRKLHSTRTRYLQSLRVIDSGRMEGTVLLDYSKDKLVKMLEEGASAFDMKEGLLDSSKVKFTKLGKKYITIPFRFNTPGTVGESDVFQTKLPKSVYEEIKQYPLIGNLNSSTKKVTKGLLLDDIPEEYALPKVRNVLQVNDKVFEEYTHKNSIYEGVFKSQDSVTGQNSYHSFRRVSEENSDPRSWVHPGLEKRDIMDTAYSNFQLEPNISISIDRVFEEMGFNKI